MISQTYEIITGNYYIFKRRLHHLATLKLFQRKILQVKAIPYFAMVKIFSTIQFEFRGYSTELKNSSPIVGCCQDLLKMLRIWPPFKNAQNLIV